MKQTNTPSQRYEQAFPFPDPQGPAPGAVLGMTLRDYFAARSLQFAFRAWEEGYFDINRDADSATDEIAECAYQLADSMLRARAK